MHRPLCATGLLLAITVLAVLLQPGTASAQTEVPVNFVKGNNAEVTEEQLDKALETVNAIFKGCDVKFNRASFTPINDANAPATPTEGGEGKYTDDMKAVAKAGQTATKGKDGVLVIVVDNFKKAEGQGPPNINGIGGGGEVIIADPFSIEANNMGAAEFGNTLAHELGHALGLTHKVLKSDKDYPNQDGGEYTQPNIMAKSRDVREGKPEVTPDQCEELKKGAKKFAKK